MPGLGQFRKKPNSSAHSPCNRMRNPINRVPLGKAGEDVPERVRLLQRHQVIRSLDEGYLCLWKQPQDSLGNLLTEWSSLPAGSSFDNQH